MNISKKNFDKENNQNILSKTKQKSDNLNIESNNKPFFYFNQLIKKNGPMKKLNETFQKFPEQNNISFNLQTIFSNDQKRKQVMNMIKKMREKNSSKEQKTEKNESFSPVRSRNPSNISDNKITEIKYFNMNQYSMNEKFNENQNYKDNLNYKFNNNNNNQIFGYQDKYYNSPNLNYQDNFNIPNLIYQDNSNNLNLNNHDNFNNQNSEYQVNYLNTDLNYQGRNYLGNEFYEQINNENLNDNNFISAENNVNYNNIINQKLNINENNKKIPLSERIRVRKIEKEQKIKKEENKIVFENLKINRFKLNILSKRKRKKIVEDNFSFSIKSKNNKLLKRNSLRIESDSFKLKSSQINNNEFINEKKNIIKSKNYSGFKLIQIENGKEIFSMEINNSIKYLNNELKGKKITVNGKEFKFINEEMLKLEKEKAIEEALNLKNNLLTDLKICNDNNKENEISFDSNSNNEKNNIIEKENIEEDKKYNELIEKKLKEQEIKFNKIKEEEINKIKNELKLNQEKEIKKALEEQKNIYELKIEEIMKENKENNNI